MADAIWNQCCTNLTTKPSYAGSCSASARASSSMLWLKNAIQAVPSDCSRVPPPGSWALRSKTPMLSSPRKPPWNRFFPLGSFRLTHQVKFTSSMLNASARNACSLARCSGSAAHSDPSARPIPSP